MTDETRQLSVEKIKRRVFDSLPEYSMSDPSGVVVGKVWKRNTLVFQSGVEWVICEYVAAGPNHCRIEERRPVFID